MREKREVSRIKCFCVCKLTGLQRFGTLRFLPPKVLTANTSANYSASWPVSSRRLVVLKPPTTWLLSLRHRTYRSAKGFSTENWSTSHWNFFRPLQAQHRSSVLKIRQCNARDSACLPPFLRSPLDEVSECVNESVRKDEISKERVVVRGRVWEME